MIAPSKWFLGSQGWWSRFEDRLSTVCHEGDQGGCISLHLGKGRREVSGFTLLLLLMLLMAVRVADHSMVDKDR